MLASKLQNIDRRVLYVALLAIVIIGLLVPIPLPLAVGKQAQDVYDAIEAAPPNKLILISTLWSASTQGENRPQTRVILQHVMRRKLRFAVVSFGDAQATTLTQEIAEEVSKEYGYKYGRDWVNWGFRQDIAGTLKGIVRDIHETIKTDSIQRKPLASHPAMAGIRNMRDVSVICEVSASGNYASWIGLVVGSTNAAFCYCPTSVMAPELYTYLDSGQIRGMLFGIKGAAEYEVLLKQQGFTTRAITPISLSLVLLFVLIGLGNWGMIAARRQEANN